MIQDLRSLLGRPALPAVATLGLLAAGCAQVGTNSITFWDVIWSMVFFFFLFMLIWIFISIFADIFRRHDLSGGVKAIWILALVILPFITALVYIIVRPKVTPQDVQLMAQADAAAKAAASVSTADEIAKLNELRTSGAISDAEYEALKKKTIEGS